MAEKKKDQYMNGNHALPKADVEFAVDNGLEKKALKALKTSKK